MTYAEAILPIAQEEINNKSDVTKQYEQFQADYRKYFVNRHLESSKGQLRALVFEKKQQGDIDEELEERLEERLAEWEEKRPGKIAMRESFRAESAFARNIFMACGILKLMSVSTGKSCPGCDAMDGQIVGIQDVILPVGAQHQGAEGPINIESNCYHPPYHDGCDCSIVAVME